MATTTRHLTVALMMAALMAASRPVLAGSADASGAIRVRSSSAVIAELIVRARERSETFRRLVETIEASDGIVYVEQGECGRGVRACLIAVIPAGPNRYLHVVVDTRRAESDLMASIGHELRHTIEVLSQPGVRTNAQMYFFYAREGTQRLGSQAFETTPAIDAGEDVRAEIRQYQRRFEE